VSNNRDLVKERNCLVSAQSLQSKLKKNEKEKKETLKEWMTPEGKIKNKQENSISGGISSNGEKRMTTRSL